jgi:integrase
MTLAEVVGFDPLKDVHALTCRAALDLANWLADLRLNDKADRTCSDYLYVGAELTMLIDKELADYTPHDITHFLLSKPEKSRPKYRSALASLFGWAYLNEMIDRNPMDRVARPRRGKQPHIDVFTDAEVALLCSLPAPDGQLLTLMLNTGLRKGECRRLQRRHIALEQAQLVVYQGKGGKDRVVGLNELVARAVAELDILEGLNSDDYLWCSRPGGGQSVNRSRPVAETTFHRWWQDPDKGVLARAGVSYRNPHVTRHTFATRLLRRGARIENVQLLMGHASIQTTVDLYGHLDLEDARADLALLEA